MGSVRAAYIARLFAKREASIILRERFWCSYAEWTVKCTQGDDREVTKHRVREKYGITSAYSV